MLLRWQNRCDLEFAISKRSYLQFHAVIFSDCDLNLQFENAAIAIAILWEAYFPDISYASFAPGGYLGPAASSRPPPETALARFGVRCPCLRSSVRRPVRRYKVSVGLSCLYDDRIMQMWGLSLSISVSLCVFW